MNESGLYLNSVQRPVCTITINWTFRIRAPSECSTPSSLQIIGKYSAWREKTNTRRSKPSVVMEVFFLFALMGGDLLQQNLCLRLILGWRPVVLRCSETSTLQRNMLRYRYICSEMDQLEDYAFTARHSQGGGRGIEQLGHIWNRWP